MTHSLKTTDLHCIHGQFEHTVCSQIWAAYVFLWIHFLFYFTKLYFSEPQYEFDNVIPVWS